VADNLTLRTRVPRLDPRERSGFVRVSERTSADILEIRVDAESQRVVLVGELDYKGASAVAEAIVTTDARTIDCCDLTYLDPRGFNALLDAHRQIEEGGGHVNLVGLNGAPLRIVRQLDAAGELHMT
jgi:anti-anti-sigma regulatory factor